jgi:hypothetical protein
MSPTFPSGFTTFFCGVLAATSAQAQYQPSANDTPGGGNCEKVDVGRTPGLYTSTDEGLTYVVQGDNIIELAPSEAAFANEDTMSCVEEVPVILDWPCSTPESLARQIPSFTLDSLDGENIPKQVVRRYFEIPEIIEPRPRWKNGDFHGTFNRQDIIQFPTIEYWYTPSSQESMLDERRPKTLQITLHVGLSLVVVDNRAIDALLEKYGGKNVPVVFNYADQSEVPISYFGRNVSLEELADAFMNGGVRVSEVPMWEIGDFHLEPTIEEFEKLFDIPALEEIDPGNLQGLVANLETRGFSRKPVFVSLMAESSILSIDQPARIRAAQSLGFDKIPTVVLYYGENAHRARCGSNAKSGTPAPGSKLPGSGSSLQPNVPPAPEIPASDS